MPVPFADRLRGRPTEAEQQREQTKNLFNEIAKLAPQVGHDYYVSSSLAQSLVSSSDSADFARIAADSLNLKEADLLHISWDSNRSPGTLLIHNNSNGTRDFAVDFDRKTFKMEGVRIENKPFHSNDQSLLNGLFESIRDDLIKRRGEWKHDLEKQRREFVERLSHQEALVLSHAMNALSDMFHQDYLIFGVVEDKDREDSTTEEKDQTKVLRLFVTQPITEEVADKVFNVIDDDLVIDSYYVKNLMQSSIDDTSIDTKMLVVRYPDFQIQVENFWPATNRNKQTIHAGHKWITEKLFEAFLEGREQTFHPLTSAQDPILLEQWVDFEDFFNTEINLIPNGPTASTATV